MAGRGWWPRVLEPSEESESAPLATRREDATAALDARAAAQERAHAPRPEPPANTVAEERERAPRPAPPANTEGEWRVDVSRLLLVTCVCLLLAVPIILAFSHDEVSSDPPISSDPPRGEDSGAHGASSSAGSNGHHDRDDDDHVDERLSNYAILFIWICIKCCEEESPCASLRACCHSLRQCLCEFTDHSTPAERRRLVVNDGWRSTRPVPQRVLDRVAEARTAIAAAERVERPQPDDRGGSASLRDDVASALTDAEEGIQYLQYRMTSLWEDDAPPPAPPVLVHEASRLECCVCMVESRDVVLSPCAHRCVCSTCAARLTADARTRKCPICRAPIENVVSIHDTSLVPTPGD